MKTSEHGRGFNPEEIIFCPTSNCNLKCAHCTVSRGDNLNVNDAVKFLKDCAAAYLGDRFEFVNSVPLKVGFSGGEPFLAIEFVCEICRVARENDLMFGNLMTNGDWWKTETELKHALQLVYDSGFDGKIGLSWDGFHRQTVQKIAAFINAAHEIFHDETCVEIWSVIPKGKEKSDNEIMKEKMAELEATLGTKIKIYRFRESTLSDDWHDKKWFAEDYCESTGQVLYVHANGKIAPCCGFANECDSLIIGKIKDSFETVMQNADKNQMVKICFEEGLSKYTKHREMKKICRGKLPKGKTSDMCQFCAWAAKNLTN